MQAIFLILLLFITNQVSANSKPPSPTPSEATAKPHSTSTDPKKYPATSNQAPQSTTPLIVNVPSPHHDEAAQNKSSETENYSSSEWWLVYLTGFLATVTAALAIFTGGLWRSTYRLAIDARENSERQATETKKSMDLVEQQVALMAHQTDILEKQKEIIRLQTMSLLRPRIILREAYAIEEGRKPISISYTLANTGGMATTIIESSLAVTFEQIDNLHKGPEFASKNVVGEITIRPGAHETRNFVAEMKWRDGSIQLSGDWGYFFSGHIVYQDNDVLRHTAFFRKYDPKTCRFVPIDDPQLEYCDERA